MISFSRRFGDLAIIHYSKSSLMLAPPRGLHRGGVELGVGLAAQAFGRDGIRGLENALEDGPFGWNDKRHVKTAASETP